MCVDLSVTFSLCEGPGPCLLYLVALVTHSFDLPHGSLVSWDKLMLITLIFSTLLHFDPW